MDATTRLLLDASDGDELALSAFVHATQAEVWRFCAGLVDPTSADDLTQEVYLRAMRSVAGFRGDASGRTWLLAVARNVCADEIRRRQRARARFLPATETELPDPTGEIDMADLVRTLDEDRREAFVLTQVLGLTYAEAAEACGVPVGTIRSRVARARGDLLDALEPRDTRASG